MGGEDAWDGSYEEIGAFVVEQAGYHNDSYGIMWSEAMCQWRATAMVGFGWGDDGV